MKTKTEGEAGTNIVGRRRSSTLSLEEKTHTQWTSSSCSLSKFKQMQAECALSVLTEQPEHSKAPAKSSSIRY